MLVLLSALFSICLSAKEVMSSYNFLANDMIPEQVFLFGANWGRTGNINSRYDNSAKVRSSQSLNTRKLSFQNLVESASSLNESILSSAAFRAYGIDLGGSAGEALNSFDINTSSQAYILGYGLNKKSNLLVIFPQVQIDVNINSRFEASNEYNRLISELDSSGQYDRADYLRKIKNEPLKTRLMENGQRLPESMSSLANILVNYRRSVGKETIWDSTLVIPAGRKYSTTDFIDFRLNDQSLGFKQALGKTWRSSRHSIGAYGQYHYRSPFRMDYRIPRNDIDPLSTDIEQNVRVKYGDQIDSTIQYNYKWNAMFNSYINFRYMESFTDSYQGKKFENSRYEVLESNTYSTNTSIQVGLAINTIEAFLQRKFLMPADLNIQASRTLSGKNSFRNDWVALNLMVFYK